MSGYIEGRLEAKRIAQIGFDIASVFKVEIIGRQRGPEVTPFDSCRRLTMRKTDIATIAKLSIFQTIKDGAYVQTIGKIDGLGLDIQFLAECRGGTCQDAITKNEIPF